ncbi:LPS assembly lipoprotein LptE [Paucibacter sp. Y2R2-4]|uniref:LPS-assembly lipoprotein LptE n=1 Tax=Paucibacter sp. Y2R2-4 TaxID=2893553 RepID=UPI0021E4D8B2|nr:LPS assembly lipoprotein LptE [Paucibacter sp. Y2R2-4]MCV2351314.1 LPS assembly lipoprotein LptE [Paucibacter sp. Y2R2-4]
MLRRRLLVSAALVGLSSLGGCGFELRKEPEFLFQRIALSGFAPGSPFATELRRQLARSPVKVVEDANKADVVLVALQDVRDKVVVSSTVAGQVREWQLRLSVDYLLRTPNDELLLPRTELRLVREMNYTEERALGKEQEEQQLHRAMQSDGVAQVMRRLAAVRLPS